MQKRLLALVATVAMVLSMFAGIAFADAVGSGAEILGSDINGNVITIAVDPEEVAEQTNPEGTTARWFEAATVDAPAGYTLHKVVRGGKVLQIHEDGTDTKLTFWLDAKATPYTNVYEVTWAHATEDDVVETWTINYEPLAEGDLREISLSTTKVISSYPGNGFQLISGSFPASNADYVVNVYKQADDSKTDPINDDPIKAKGGTFSFYLPTELEPQDIYVVASLAGLEVAEAEVEVRYNVTTNPAKLEFSFTGEQSPVAITGTVTNSKGEPVAEGTKVFLQGKTKPYFGLTGIGTNAKGEFGYVVLEWAQAEDLVLSVGTVPHVDGEVKAKAATLKVTPSTTAHTLVEDQPFTLEGLGFGANASVDITYAKMTGVVGAANVTANSDGKFELDFTWSPKTAGTYTITAKSAAHEAKATITVTNPASLNWMNTDLLDELEVGDNVIAFGSPNGVYVTSYNGTTSVPVTDYVVSVDGKEKLDTREAGNTVTITPTKLGTVTIEVVAYNGETKVTSRTFTAKVNGLDVDVDYTELTVNKKHTVTFVVKDAEGVPVNNATISFDGVVKVNPANVNIQNGTYVVKDFEPKVVKPVEVVIKGVKDAKATLTLDVVGDKVYTVTADVEALLQGKGEDVELTVTRDGVAVMPQRIKWVYEDGTSDQAHPAYVGDGVSKVKINAAQAGELVVRAENFDGTLCGEVILEVVAPKLVLVDEEVANLTNNFKTEVTFKVVDPRDDSVIKDNLKIVQGDYIDELAVYDANDGLLFDTVLGGEEHALTILAEVSEDTYKKAAKDEKVVAVSFKLGEVTLDGAFEVKNATITSDPGMIVIGANNNLTLTYEDANGNPIEGKKVTAGDADLGKTDENGQVIYPVSIATAAVKVLAATDVDKVNVEHSIKIGYDAEAPQVDYTLDGNKATIVITDNVRLVRINIDGQEIDFWPGAKYEFVRTLQPGVNKFNIKAQDSNDNVFNEVVEIEYLTDAIVLDGANVSRQGDYLFVQARQFADFGAEFAWNQATKTATFVLDDVKVEVTIGSTTAKVNGETVTMPVAPFLANDRTYVPVRFISENLGWNVHWAAGDVVTITLP